MELKSSLLKDIFRDIQKSKGRFVSILVMVALGVAFFAGIKNSPMVMKASADKYYDEYNLMDIRLISPLGLSDKDIRDVSNIREVEKVTPYYFLDVMGKYNSRDINFKAISIPEEAEKDNDEGYVNEINLIEGRMPKKENECLIEKQIFKENDVPIGSKITLSSGSKIDISSNLNNNLFEVVGIVQTPYYLSYEKGNSSIGNGKVESFIMLPKENFKLPGYTEASITIKDCKDFNSYDDNGYLDTVNNSINKIKHVNPNWILLNRDFHSSYLDYGNAAKSVEALAKVFPFLFFLVTVLVCITTMTRMVDEQRGNIGTMKALGYSKGKIASKYLIYALLASLIGSVLGLTIAFTVFPTIVFYSYGMMYSIPKIHLVFSVKLAIIATLIAVLVTTLSAILACYKELKETPSILMRPKAPKSGKRIVLERIPFIWKRLKFTSKVTVRNIFRYKKRFLMTTIGVAGCTALLLIGFGIKDSIKTVADKQFGSIFNYDLSIYVDKTLKDSQILNIKKNVLDTMGINNCALTGSENGEIEKEGKAFNVTIMTAENKNEFKKLINLENRLSKKTLNLDNSEIILTEKAARELGVKEGDKITLINESNKVTETIVKDIAENYIGHYVYMTKEAYENLFNDSPKFTEIIASLKDIDKESEEEVAKNLSDNDEINGVNFNSAIKTNFDDTIKNLNYVVSVLIVSAALLVFVVLYNLTNVNISERIREIATIKVLGFYDNEVATYVYRENIILTLIGTFIGLGLGVILHQFIMVTVEMRSMMFGRNIDSLSFIYSAVLTLGFAIIVNYAMYHKLKNIKMIESLKSVE